MSEFKREIISKLSETIISKLSETIISMPSTLNSSKRRQSQVWEQFEQLDISRKKKGKCTYCRKVLPE